MKDSAIEWTDHTFIPWEGCSKVSPGCAHCYAENRLATRFKRVGWGPGAPRRRTSEDNWKQPLKWDRIYRGVGRRSRVFTNSAGDVFDREVPDPWRWDLIHLIDATPNLTWQLLTKRPEGAAWWKSVWRGEFQEALARSWIGISVEDQTWAERRLPWLRALGAFDVRFLSVEPMLGPIDLGKWLDHVDWVICGGESGAGARRLDPAWVKNLRDQCESRGVPFFFKQWGGVRKRENGRLLEGKEYNQFPYRPRLAA